MKNNDKIKKVAGILGPYIVEKINEQEEEPMRVDLLPEGEATNQIVFSEKKETTEKYCGDKNTEKIGKHHNASSTESMF